MFPILMRRRYAETSKTLKMKLYDYKAIDKLIAQYAEKGGETTQINDGVLGSGDWLLTGLSCCFVITEVYVSEWESSHKARRYKKLPKKYDKFLI